MRDIYLMNRTTGEIEPSESVFREFYKTHSGLESVFDYWMETPYEVEGAEIENPLVTIIKSVRI